MKVLSICCGMGLLDRAFMDSGFVIVPGCEIDPEMRLLYSQLCGGNPLHRTLSDLLESVHLVGPIDGIIGGPPCQAHSKMKAMRHNGTGTTHRGGSKFPDLTPQVRALIELVNPKWYLFENVVPLDIHGSERVCLDAMHFGKPHQSRPRWFTHSPNITAPTGPYKGNVDDLMAYPVVMGHVYGPKRGARLQGYASVADLKASCRVLQKGIANAVHYDVGRAWAESITLSQKRDIS